MLLCFNLTEVFIRIVLLLVFLASFPGFCSELLEYSLSINRQYLNQLYENPYSENEYPGVLSCSSWSVDCTVRFRGKSSLEFPKKSWAISFPDPTLTGRERLNLNAEYMDPGMMRNCISMRVTELLGFPASRTEHVKFFVNGDYQGVFLDVERVDGHMFRRYGYEPVALFKAQNEGARFMPGLSGEYQSGPYRARSYSEHLYHHLLEFINMIDAGVSPLPADKENLMAYYAVSLALTDRDAGSNNYYFMLASDGRWRVFPWDRGSCMGSLSDGVFHPEMAYFDVLFYFKINALFHRLEEDEECRAILEEQLNQVNSLLACEIPLLIDSVFQHIRPDLCADPCSRWTPLEIDQARNDMLWFCSERHSFLRDNCVLPEHGQMNDLSIGTPWLEAGDTTSIFLEVDDVYTVVRLRWFEGGSANFRFLHRLDGKDRTIWTVNFTMPSDADCCPMDFFFRKPGQERLTFYYPGYSLDMYSVFHPAAPCFVNPAPGTVPPGSPGDFSLLSPVRYGPLLWALPIVNVSGHGIDVSRCGFALGDSPHRVFLPEGMVLNPMDTLFIASSLESFTVEFPWRTAAGDLRCAAPDSGSLTMFDPLWQNLWKIPVPRLEDSFLYTPGLTITEICPSQPPDFLPGDWLELCNLSSETLSIGGYILKDMNGNATMIEEETSLLPGEFIVLAEEPELFQLLFPVECQIGNLGFGINASEESLCLYNRCGSPLQRVSWTGEECLYDVRGLLHPSLPPELASSWEVYRFPGTPGTQNRLWNARGRPMSVSLITENPSESRTLGFTLSSLSFPVEVTVFDLAGRRVLDPFVLSRIDEEHSLELPYGIPPGIYFLVLRSPGETAAVKFTRL